MHQMNIPALPEIIQRTRPEQLLEAALDTRLTLVSGSPGQGKTTLVSSVLQRLSYDVFWYSLDNSNSTILQFISGLLGFLRTFPPVSGTDPNSICSGSVTDIYAALLNVLNKAPLGNRLVVVLDDFQAIKESSDFDIFIQLLLCQTPPDYHFVIITRRNPQWELAQKAIQRKMRYISDKQLAFSLQETREFFREIYHIDLPRKQLAEIMDIVEGWTPIMITLGEMWSREQDMQPFLNADAARLIKKIPMLRAYLEQECFNVLSPEQLNVLLAVSVVEELPPGLIDVLAGENGLSILHDLAAMNMLVYSAKGESTDLRLHTLWRSFLGQKAAEMWDGDRIRNLHKRAGDYYFARKNWNKAINHYVRGNELARAIDVLKNSGFYVLDFELADPLQALIMKISPGQRDNDPWLSYALACSAYVQYPTLCDQYLQKAWEGFRNANDSVGELNVLGLRGEMLLYLGDFQQLQNIISEQSGTDLEQINLKTKAQYNYYAAHAHCFLTGNLKEAVRLGEESRRIGIMLKDNYTKIWADYALAVFYNFLGNFDVAQVRLAEACKAINLCGIDHLTPIYFMYTTGRNLGSMGEFAASGQIFEEAQQKAQNVLGVGGEVLKFYLDNYHMYTALYLGDFELCEQLFKEMADIIGMCFTGKNDHIISYYWMWKAHYMYVRGQYHEAAAFADQALKLREKAGGEIYFLQCQLLLGAAYRELGNLTDAEIYLQEALRRSIGTGSTYYMAACYFQLVLLYDLSGNKELYSENMARLFAIAIEKSYYHFLLWRDEHVARIIAQTEDRVEYQVYIKELCRRRFGGAKMDISQPHVKPLKISLLGPLVIEINGTEHYNPGLKKPIYLLSLLAAKSAPVSIETVIEEIWQETDIKVARNNFYYTLNRLRNFLGNRDFIVLKDGFCSLNINEVWIDISHFKTLNEQAARYIDLNRLPEAVALLQESFRVFRGEFLEGEFLGPLLALEREALAKQMYDSMVLLGKLLMQTGEYEEAANILSKSVSMSFADENSYRLLMLAYYALCDSAQALRIYSNLENYIASEYKTSPHRKTRELKDLIRQGSDWPVADLVKWLAKEE